MRFDLSQYSTVEERLKRFWQEHPNGAVHTEMLAVTPDHKSVIIRASVHFDRADPMAAGVGIAQESIGSGANQNCWVENCVPLDTEILTPYGWQRHDEMRVGQLVLSYDHANDCAEWVPLEDVTVIEAAPVVRLFNGWGFDAVCTPAHKWPVIYNSVGRKGEKYLYRNMRETQRLSSKVRIVTACAAPSGTSGITSQQAAIMGWLLTDGHIRREGKAIRGHIYQSKPCQTAIIEEMLSDVPHSRDDRPASFQKMPSGQVSPCLPSFRWNLPAAFMRELFDAFLIDNETQVDAVIPQMSEFARSAMLRAMMLADGTERGRFGKKKPWVMKTYSLLCAVNGISLPKIRYKDGDMPQQTAKSTRHTYAMALKTEDAGTADVWCPTTKHGTWYARFANGFTTITGNCDTSAVGRALANCGYSGDKRASREEMVKAGREPDVLSATGPGGRFSQQRRSGPAPPAQSGETGEVKPCYKCSAPVRFGPGEGGKVERYNADGGLHFKTCGRGPTGYEVGEADPFAEDADYGTLATP